MTPEFIENLRILDRVAHEHGSALSELELVLMEHTECGANALTPTDPRTGVRADMEALAIDPSIPGSLSVTGLVYETATGRVELVERRSPPRAA